jgi:hypothetical protein
MASRKARTTSAPALTKSHELIRLQRRPSSSAQIQFSDGAPARDLSPRKIAPEANMVSKFLQWFAAFVLIGDHALAACDGPDSGDVTTVITVPANEAVDVYHFRAARLMSVVEFCVREPGAEWILVAAHGDYASKWSLLQSWAYPKTVQIKTTAVVDGDLSAFRMQTRAKTTYGYSFSWSDNESAGPNDQIVYCFGGGAGCPASRRIDFSE